jgi:hypothetical protein
MSFGRRQRSNDIGPLKIYKTCFDSLNGRWSKRGAAFVNLMEIQIAISLQNSSKPVDFFGVEFFLDPSILRSWIGRVHEKFKFCKKHVLARAQTAGALASPSRARNMGKTPLCAACVAHITFRRRQSQHT